MKLKTFIAMGLLSMFGLGSCNAQQKDNTAKKELHYTMNESAPKNYYLLTMSSNGCNFRILIMIFLFGTFGTKGHILVHIL